MSGGAARPRLPDVTLVAVTSVALRPTVDALQASMRQAEFADVILLSDRRPPVTAPAIDWRRIDPLASRADYSRFMLRGLADHVATSHALCIQWDGFVLNGDAWKPEFLDYDYIGAVWPQFDDDHNVGNGGFSLRSKRLLTACRSLPFAGSQAEDIVISRVFRKSLEDQGIRFAPASLARKFAYERTASTGKEFGFHGAYNLIRLLSRKDAVDVFGTLEPAMLARNERLELFRFALRRGWPRLALTMLARLI